MKTGFTDQAGSCLVASAEKDGIEMIAVTMNALSIDARNNDLKTMFDAAFCVMRKSIVSVYASASFVRRGRRIYT